MIGPTQACAFSLHYGARGGKGLRKWHKPIQLWLIFFFSKSSWLKWWKGSSLKEISIRLLTFLYQVICICTVTVCPTVSHSLCKGLNWMVDVSGLGQTDTFFAHANTETLLQSTVLALVPVVLVNLTLSVWPENINKWLLLTFYNFFFFATVCRFSAGLRLQSAFTSTSGFPTFNLVFTQNQT